MKKLLAIVIFLFSCLLLWFGLIMVASESGEVVSLYTLNTSGEENVTRLWVVDDGSMQYLRSGDIQSGWTQRLLATEAVEMERNGQRLRYQAELKNEKRDKINQLMASKYGWADRLIDFFFSREDAIPVQLIRIDSN